MKHDDDFPFEITMKFRFKGGRSKLGPLTEEYARLAELHEAADGTLCRVRFLDPGSVK